MASDRQHIMKKFTVNGVPFEVTQKDYDGHFLMADVDNEHGRFEGIDEYVLDGSFDPEDIKRSLTIFIRDVPNYDHDAINPYTGTPYDTDHSSYYYDWDDQSLIVPEIIIEFADKYIKDARYMITQIIGQISPFDDHFDCILGGYIDNYNYLKPVAKLINRAIPGLFEYEWSYSCCSKCNDISLDIKFTDDHIELNVVRGGWASYDDRMRHMLCEISTFMHEHNLRPKFGNRAIQLYFDYCFDLYEIFGNTKCKLTYEQVGQNLNYFSDYELEPLRKILDKKMKAMIAEASSAEN